MEEWNFFPIFFFPLTRPKNPLNFLKGQKKMRGNYFWKHLKSQHSFWVLRKFPAAWNSLKHPASKFISSKVFAEVNCWEPTLRLLDPMPSYVEISRCNIHLFLSLHFLKLFCIRIVKTVLNHLCTVVLSSQEWSLSDHQSFLSPSQYLDLKSPVTQHVREARDMGCGKL